ncbi:GNAT family N-acetyltransferase [Embleya sp. NBC_00896]|uniref:GNAT family N-acetyltransferase n=1 Tax=Embleya sp. NBC_00896 TaxID=2975961 RepID=UPI002F90FB7C|nr:N-acetyltransferase [Embleya sp. NBC_00896]
MQARVIDNPEQSRYEIFAGVDAGELAGYAEYFLGDDEIAFIHTEVDRRFEGHGLAGVLVRGALDAARERGLGVVPNCDYLRAWMRKHPEYLDLVPEQHRAPLGL